MPTSTWEYTSPHALQEKDCGRQRPSKRSYQFSTATFTPLTVIRYAQALAQAEEAAAAKAEAKARANDIAKEKKKKLQLAAAVAAADAGEKDRAWKAPAGAAVAAPDKRQSTLRDIFGEWTAFLAITMPPHRRVRIFVFHAKFLLVFAALASLAICDTKISCDVWRDLTFGQTREHGETGAFIASAARFPGGKCTLTSE